MNKMIWTLALSSLALVGCAGHSEKLTALEKRVNALEAAQSKAPTQAPQVASNDKRLDTLIEALGLMTQGQLVDVMARLPEIKQQQEAQRIADSIAENTAHDIPVDGSPVEGPADAKVTLVEFSDMECPYCVRSAPRIKALAEQYKGKIRVIYKHFPLSFHKAAKGAHAASRAAEMQGKFWEFRYQLAAQASNNAGTALTEANYIKLAAELKLDAKKFKADMAVSADDETRFSQDMALGSKIGVSGTPTYFINGKKADSRTLEADVAALLK